MEQDRRYALPRMAKPPVLGKRQVQLVASGDLRASANEKCWPEQVKMEEALTRRWPRGVRAGPGPPIQAGRSATASSARRRKGMDVFRTGVDPGRAARSSPRRVAVLAPRAARADRPPRPDPHRRQLVGHLAGAGRHAQPQRLAHQGGRRVLDASGARTSPTSSSRGRSGRWLRKGEIRHDASHVTRAAQGEGARAGTEARRGARRAARARAGDPRRLRRGVHGDVQRDHPRPPAQPDRRVQGAAQPVGPVLRNDAGAGRRGARRAATGWSSAG